MLGNCDIKLHHHSVHISPYCMYCRLYIDSSHHNEEVKSHLCVGSEGGVVLRDYGDMWEDVTSLVKGTEGKIWVRARRGGRGNGKGGREGGSEGGRLKLLFS